MGQLAAVRKKLRESIFFYRHLSNEKTVLKPETEDVEFFLSAFLSAGRSMIGFFDMHYFGWFYNWKMSLVEGDRKLLKDMVRQRNLEVHEGGADIIPQFELVSKTAAETEDLSSHSVCISVPLETKKYYSWLDAKLLDVNSTCKHYLELLIKLINDFDESLTTGD